MSSSSASFVSLQMRWRRSRSSPSTSTPSSARTAKKFGVSKVMSQLSSAPEPWSALRLRASGFPIVFLDWWCMTKSKRARVSDHRACLRLSFFADMKYSKFLWSVQILNLLEAPSKKCHYSSSAQMMANISLLWIL